MEAFPKVQVNIPILELIKEDVLEATISKEVRFYDTRQVITPKALNLAECNSPKSLSEFPSISPWCGKDVRPKTFELVFVLELHTGKPPPRISISFSTNMLLKIHAPNLEFKPLPYHFKYHLPFKDPLHAVGPSGA